MDERYRFTPRQRFWAMAGFVVCFIVVGGSAFASSYTHIRDISLIKHQSAFVANMMPWSVDGMMGIAAIAMFVDSRTGRYPRGWARFAFWFALIASMGANVGSFAVVWGVDVWGMVVAAAPPAFFMVSVEIVSKPGKLRQVVDKVERVVGMVREARAAAGPREPAPEAQRPGVVEPAAAPGQAPSRVMVGEVMPAAGRRGRWQDEEPLPVELVALARRVGAGWRERTGRMITRVQLRDEIKAAGGPGISNVTAGRLLEEIRKDANGSDALDEAADQGADAESVLASNGAGRS